MDREKVIKALEICEKKDCVLCPYTYWCGEYDDSYCDCTKLLAKDALALLKEQEAFKPLAKENSSYECICGAIVGFDELDAGGIVQIRFDYCPFCGKHISWEGR